MVVDLDFESCEAGGVAVQLIEPLLLHGIELLAQLRGDLRQGRDEGAGLGLAADLHGRLRGAGLQTDQRLCYRDPRATATFRESTHLQRFRDGQLPAGQEMAGRHVVAQVDGGRFRIRTQIEAKKRKGVKYRRKIRVEWREPKLLILYLSDRRGRMLEGRGPGSTAR